MERIDAVTAYNTAIEASEKMYQKRLDDIYRTIVERSQRGDFTADYTLLSRSGEKKLIDTLRKLGFAVESYVDDTNDEVVILEISWAHPEICPRQRCGLITVDLKKGLI